MSALTAQAAPARPRRIPLAVPARLLRLELRRNPMPWTLPLLAALFWITTYRPAMVNPPLWNVRGTMLQAQTMLAFAPVLAGVAAWAGSREGRRGTADLVSITGVPRWAGRLAAWAAVTFWAEAAYLGGVTVVYAITAREAIWGGPLWWPVTVGAATAAASCAVGFAAGTLLPSRFTAPLAAVVVFLALGAGAFALQHGARATYSQIWPLNVQGAFPKDSFGIFYPFLPDLSIAQLMFVGGLGASALGALGLPIVAGGRWLRGAAAAVTIVGLAAAGTAVGLAGTARLEAHGIVIPALHDAASDRPVPYTPVCSHSAIPVCLHSAYRANLPEVSTALNPLLQELTGLPGAPTRVVQAAVTSVQPGPGNGANFGGPVISGTPPVMYLPLSGLTLPGEGATTAEFTGALRGNLLPLLNAFVGLNSQVIQQWPTSEAAPPGSAAAQAAVAMALAEDGRVPLQAAGSPVPPLGPGTSAPGGGRVTGGDSPTAGPTAAAARRFAALPATACHAWLLTHLAALRAGQITLREIP